VTRHPDPGVLAECREGLLGRRRSARIRAHVAGCPHCASLDAGLAEVTALLASSPAPSMPSHLIARLDSALAAEAASRPQPADAAPAGASGDPAGTFPGGTTPQPDRPGPAPGDSNHGWRPGRRPARSAGPARRRPTVLGAAAAGVIVLAGAGYGLASLAQQPGGAAASSGASAGRASGGAPGSGHSAAQNGAIAGPAKAGPGSTLRVIHSGTDYQPGTLAHQAQNALDSRFAASSGLAPGTGSARLQSCVMLITGGASARLVDVAHYRGQPATIIVRAPSAGKPGQIWVAGPACSAQHRDILAHTSLPSSG
jgi:hypothetical protein